MAATAVSGSAPKSTSARPSSRSGSAPSVGTDTDGAGASGLGRPPVGDVAGSSPGSDDSVPAGALGVVTDVPSSVSVAGAVVPPSVPGTVVGAAVDVTESLPDGAVPAAVVVPSVGGVVDVETLPGTVVSAAFCWSSSFAAT